MLKTTDIRRVITSPLVIALLFLTAQGTTPPLHADDGNSQNENTSGVFSVISSSPILLQGTRNYHLSTYRDSSLLKTVEIGRGSHSPYGFWSADGRAFWLVNRIPKSKDWEIIEYDPVTLLARNRHKIGPRPLVRPGQQLFVNRLSFDGSRIFISVFVDRSHKIRTLRASDLAVISEQDVGTGFIDVEEMKNHHVAVYVDSGKGDRRASIIDTNTGNIKYQQTIIARAGVTLARTPKRDFLTITDQLDRLAAGQKKRMRVTVVNKDGIVTSKIIIGENGRLLTGVNGEHWFLADNEGHSQLWRVGEAGKLNLVKRTAEPCKSRSAAVDSTGERFVVFCNRKLQYFNGTEWQSTQFKTKIQTAILSDDALFAMQRKGSNIIRFDLERLTETSRYKTSSSASVIMQALFGGGRYFLSSMYLDEAQQKIYVIDSHTANIAALDAQTFTPITTFNLGSAVIGFATVTNNPLLFVRAVRGVAAINTGTGELSYEVTGDYVGIDPANNRLFLKQEKGVELVNLNTGEKDIISTEYPVESVHTPAWGTRFVKVTDNPFQVFIH